MLLDTAEYPKIETLDLSPQQAELERIVHFYLQKEYQIDDPAWLAIVEQNKNKIINSGATQNKNPPHLIERIRKYLSMHNPIKSLWDKQWRDNVRLNESYFSSAGAAAPYEWKGRCLQMPNAGGTLTRMLSLMKVIHVLQPKSVLEVASGDGLNLFLLASFFPHIQFSGIELTKGGVEVARAFQKQAELPAYISDLFPKNPMDKMAFKKIQFHQGDAKKLGWKDNSVDMVISCVGLEQMESIRDEALSEISRVTARWTAMLEPFRDFNKEGITREYVRINHYFEGSIQELARYGLEPVFVSDNMPQKLNLRVGLVVSKIIR